jgi:hypothetical protein
MQLSAMEKRGGLWSGRGGELHKLLFASAEHKLFFDGSDSKSKQLEYMVRVVRMHK